MVVVVRGLLLLRGGVGDGGKDAEGGEAVQGLRLHRRLLADRGLRSGGSAHSSQVRIGQVIIGPFSAPHLQESQPGRGVQSATRRCPGPTREVASPGGSGVRMASSTEEGEVWERRSLPSAE